MADTTAQAGKKEKKVQEVKAPVDMKISDILKMLDNGQDRKAIALHYGVTQATLKRVFDSSPKLKGKKVKPTVPVNLIDDTDDVVAAPKANAPVAENTEVAPGAGAAQAPATEEVAAPAGNAAGGSAQGMW